MKNGPAKYFDKKVLIFYYQTPQKIKNWQISFLKWFNGLVEVPFTVIEVYVLNSDSGQHTT